MPVVDSITFQPHPACKNFNDLTGKVYDLLMVLGYAGSDKWWNGLWFCRCICGNVKAITTVRLTGTRPHTKSCGCFQANFKHGHTKHNSPSTPEYSAWEGMNQRCSNPNTHRYDRYGGRGITICGRWRGEHGFQNFFSDIGLRPSPGHSLDRWPDPNGNYEPNNVRWATQAEQNRNRSGNHNITFQGETMCVTDWAKRLGLSLSGLRHRLKNWDVGRALTAPVDYAHVHKRRA